MRAQFHDTPTRIRCDIRDCMLLLACKCAVLRQRMAREELVDSPSQAAAQVSGTEIAYAATRISGHEGASTSVLLPGPRRVLLSDSDARSVSGHMSAVPSPVRLRWTAADPE
eukprot:3941930-Rhodomonas_salina.29